MPDQQMPAPRLSLPPGQRAADRFPRFGAITRPLPEAPGEPRLRISGAVETEFTFGLEELRVLPRHEQESALHCVTTWTKEGLSWSGWRLADLYRHVIEPRCRPRPEVRYLILFGDDGYRCSLHLDDVLGDNALADPILIADTLDGEPLSSIHGAPLRVVSPGQYGYKNLKHLAGIGLRAKPITSPLGLEHPRGRVDHQERNARYPAWLVRRPYRALIGATAFFQHRGIRSRHFVGRPTLLDELMPNDEHFEVHDIWLDASPDEAYRALLTLRGDEIRLLRPLMALRELPARLVGRTVGGDRNAPVLESLVAGGFVKLAEEPGREIVLGVVGRFWKLTGNAPVRSVHDRQTFTAFNQQGYAKAAMNLLVRAEGRGSRLITETRIDTTDPTAARSFRRYWRWVRPGSGLIRRSWLKAVQRRLI